MPQFLPTPLPFHDGSVPRLRVIVPVLAISGVLAWAVSDDGQGIRRAASSLGLLLQYGSETPATAIAMR